MFTRFRNLVDLFRTLILCKSQVRILPTLYSSRPLFCMCFTEWISNPTFSRVWSCTTVLCRNGRNWNWAKVQRFTLKVFPNAGYGTEKQVEYGHPRVHLCSSKRRLPSKATVTNMYTCVMQDTSQTKLFEENYLLSNSTYCYTSTKLSCDTVSKALDYDSVEKTPITTGLPLSHSPRLIKPGCG
jgi:hypothetical protein